MKKKEWSQHAGACQELVRIVTYYNTRSYREWRLAKDLSSFYEEYGPGILASFSKLHDVKLIFPSKTMETVNPGMVAKKASLYSGASLCVLPYSLHTANYKLDNAGLFEDFVIRCSPVIRTGKLVPFPLIDNMPVYKTTSSFSESSEARHMEEKVSDEKIEGYAIRSESIPIFGKEEELIRQINEDEPELTLSHAATRRIFLPTLDGIDLDTLLKVMEDNGDPTLKFRYALKEMLVSDNSLLNERKLFDAMEKIDLAIRDLNVEMDIIKRDRALRQFEVFIGAITVGVSLLSPAWMSEVATKVFGSLTAIDGVRNLIEITNAERKIKANDFYLPWLISKKKKVA